MTIKERFLSKVEKTETCWTWKAGTFNETGYGQFWMRRRPHGAHVASYKLFVGKVPKGLMVRHKCDNRICVNPDHLEIGTHSDNMKDMIRRGRADRKGEKAHNVKLDNKTVKRIKRALRSGKRVIDIHRSMAIRIHTVSDIKHGRIWKNVVI